MHAGVRVDVRLLLRHRGVLGQRLGVRRLDVGELLLGAAAVEKVLQADGGGDGPRRAGGRSKR